MFSMTHIAAYCRAQTYLISWKLFVSGVHVSKITNKLFWFISEHVSWIDI